MTAELINLKRARKNKEREQAAQSAEQNRVKFGRSKHEKTVEIFEVAKQKAELDGKKSDV